MTQNGGDSMGSTQEYELDEDEPEIKRARYSMEERTAEANDSYPDTQEYSLDANDIISIGNPDQDEGRSDDPASNFDGCETVINKTVPNLCKIDSVQKDAKNVAALLGLACEDVIYKKLEAKRGAENRADVVTNEILENGLDEPHDAEDHNKAVMSGEGEDSILSEIDHVVNFLKKEHPSVKYDPNRIYELLELHSDKADKVEAVINLLLGNSKSESDQLSIADDVKLIMKRFPHADANHVFTILAKNENKEDRVEIAIDQLIEGRKREKTDCDIDNPLIRDMHIIAKMFPGVDRQEIYAYLEAHHDRHDRIQIVTEEFLLMNNDKSAGSIVRNPGLDQLTSKSDCLTDEVDKICAIFPDCDPNFICEKLLEMGNDPDRGNRLTDYLLKNRDYPKLSDVVEKPKLGEDVVDSAVFDIDSFLQAFPDPKTTFYDEEKDMSEAYKQQAITLLKNAHPMLVAGFITKKFGEHKSHYLPTHRELQKSSELYLRNEAIRKRRRYRKKPRGTEPLPKGSDEFLLKETQFTDKEVEILAYIQLKKDEKQRRFEEAKSEGHLMECGCCYDDEVLFEDMTSCPEGHLFCKECVRRSSEEVIGQGKISFPCLVGEECIEEFAMPILQQVLPCKVFSILLQKIQEDEINRAAIDDLVSCPFCSFATIMPNKDDKVFKCLNPECLKESCRLCKEPSHIPLRCEEVEKQGETDMRTFIEMRVSEAMLRTCWRCKKRFFKTEGCNKMTCTCGASMCYVCREPIIDYNHFSGDGCPQDTDVMKLHAEEMRKAAEEARAKFELDHPEAFGMQLKYDPSAMIESMKNKSTGGGDLFRLGDYYEEDYRDDSDDGDNYDEYEEIEEQEFQDALMRFRRH